MYWIHDITYQLSNENIDNLNCQQFTDVFLSETRRNKLLRGDLSILKSQMNIIGQYFIFKLYIIFVHFEKYSLWETLRGLTVRLLDLDQFNHVLHDRVHFCFGNDSVAIDIKHSENLSQNLRRQMLFDDEFDITMMTSSGVPSLIMWNRIMNSVKSIDPLPSVSYILQKK